MDKISLQAVTRELGRKASDSEAGRAARTIFGGHEKHLRQTVVSLSEGSQLGEHDSPGEATLLVISGRLLLVAGEDSWPGREWDYLIMPDAPHSVHAQTDTTFMLTVSMRGKAI